MLDIKRRRKNRGYEETEECNNERSHGECKSSGEGPAFEKIDSITLRSLNTQLVFGAGTDNGEKAGKRSTSST